MLEPIENGLGGWRWRSGRLGAGLVGGGRSIVAVPRVVHSFGAPQPPSPHRIAMRWFATTERPTTIVAGLILVVAASMPGTSTAFA